MTSSLPEPILRPSGRKANFRSGWWRKDMRRAQWSTRRRSTNSDGTGTARGLTLIGSRPRRAKQLRCLGGMGWKASSGRWCNGTWQQTKLTHRRNDGTGLATGDEGKHAGGKVGATDGV